MLPAVLAAASAFAQVPPPDVTAHSWVLVDATSNQVLASGNPDRDFSEYYSIFSEKEFTYNKIKQPNRNRLLWLDLTVDGLKTGHTKAAGYCLIATAKRPLAGVPDASRRLVAVMMGEPKEHNRVQDSLKMLNYGYRV